MTTLHLFSFIAGLVGIYVGVTTIKGKSIRIGFGLPSFIGIDLHSNSAVIFGIVVFGCGILFLLPLFLLPFIGSDESAKLMPIVSAIAIFSLVVAFVIGIFLNALAIVESKSQKKKK